MVGEREGQEWQVSVRASTESDCEGEYAGVRASMEGERGGVQ